MKKRKKEREKYREKYIKKERETEIGVCASLTHVN
jgi:hypothetical protein